MSTMEKKIFKQFVNILDAYENKGTLTSTQGQALDGYSALANFINIAKEAGHYLANQGISE